MKKILFSAMVLVLFVSQNMYAETFNNADDICYDKDRVLLDPHGVGGCVDIGPFRGGFNCTMTIPLRNISGEALTDTTIVWDIDTGFEMSMIENCGIDGSAGDCEFDAAFDFGPIRMFENSIKYAPMPLFTASGSDAKHSIYFYNLMSVSLSPLTMFRGDDLYAAYTKDGDSYSGRISACLKSTTPVEDLCYSKRGITYDGAMCVDFGPFKGGMGCKQTIPIRSLTDQNLTSVEIALDLRGMNGDFLSTCGIDDRSGNCTDKALFNFGPMGMMTRGVFFEPMADYDTPYQKHSIFIQSLASMRFEPGALFTGTNMYAHYTKNGTDVAGPIPACPESREPVEDLCYETPIDYSPTGLGACVDFGPFRGGVGCKEKIVIRSITDKTLTTVDMFLDTHGMSGTFLGRCGINDIDKKGHGCEVKNRFNFGPMGFFSSGVIYDPMVDYAPFDVHSIYTVAGMEMGGDIRSFFLGENLYTSYIKDSNLTTGRILPCQENHADDLCIRRLTGSGFIGMQKAVVENQRGHNVTKVSAALEFGSLFSGTCKLDGVAGNGWRGSGYCADNSALDIIGGFFGSGTLFYEHAAFAFTPGQSHTLEQFTLLSSGIQSVQANFVRNSEFFSTELADCLDPTILSETMPLDAWDAYRRGLDKDRNISTKIVNEPFTLVLASLKNDYSAYQNQSVSSKIYYDLYENGSTTPVPGVSGGGFFDASVTHSKYQSFTVPDGYRDLFVGFKVCSINIDGKNQLRSDSECVPGEAALPEDMHSATPKWHVIESDDHFAVRPKSIVITSPRDTDISKLRSGKTYTFGLKAAYWDNAGRPRAVPSYNKSLGQDDINETLMLATNTPDDANILAGDLNLTSAPFVNGEADADLYFTDVARVIIGFEDKDWAVVDFDDTPQSCEGGFLNFVNVPDGAFICGGINTTFIPDHFALKSVQLGNHDNGNFTYLGVDQDTGDTNNDIDMSAHIDMTVVAENALNQPTKNFREGVEFYENPVSVTLTVPTKVVNGITMVPFKHDLNTMDLMPAIALGFGTDDDYGTYHFAWDTAETVKKLNFNYEKDPSAPIRPFGLSVTDPDFDINVTSVYGGVEISGATTNPAELSGVAIFHYAKVDATKTLFNNISTGSVRTPIRALVYCPLDPAICATLAVDTVSGATTDDEWWLSTGHQQNRGDGNIKLRVSSTSDGRARITPPVARIQTGGITNALSVIHQSGTMPQTVNIGLAPGTDPWMITTDMGYAVRFTGLTGWSGHGDVGYVVDSNESASKTTRARW